MSAFIVGATHIDALLTAALAWRMPPWTGPEGHVRMLTRANAGGWGAALAAENRASVNHRYEAGEWEQPYLFQPLPGVPAPVVILKALASLEYQSCEQPGWADSEARGFCEALRATAIRQLPGYRQAPWEITHPAQALTWPSNDHR